MKASSAGDTAQDQGQWAQYLTQALIHSRSSGNNSIIRSDLRTSYMLTFLISIAAYFTDENIEAGGGVSNWS